MLEDRMYTWNQLLETEFDPDIYEWFEETGEFVGVLDSKTWGRKKLSGAAIACVTLEDGRKIKFACWQHRKPPYFGLPNISIGTTIKMEFKASKRSGLSAIIALSEV